MGSKMLLLLFYISYINIISSINYTKFIIFDIISTENNETESNLNVS